MTLDIQAIKARWVPFTNYQGQPKDDIEKLIAEVGRLRQALAFYADEANWVEDGSDSPCDFISGPAVDDQGTKARAALQGKEEAQNQP